MFALRFVNAGDRSRPAFPRQTRFRAVRVWLQNTIRHDLIHNATIMAGSIEKSSAEISRHVHTIAPAYLRYLCGVTANPRLARRENGAQPTRPAMIVDDFFAHHPILSWRFPWHFRSTVRHGRPFTSSSGFLMVPMVNVYTFPLENRRNARLAFGLLSRWSQVRILSGSP